MRIDCPQCNAVYDLPPDKLPPGRAVRCVRCTQLWTPIPQVEAPDLRPPPRVAELRMPTPAPAEALGASTDPAVPAPTSTLDRMKLPGAWLLSVLVLVALGWTAIHRRADIMQAWPPSERAYIAVGLAPRP